MKEVQMSLNFRIKESASIATIIIEDEPIVLGRPVLLSTNGKDKLFQNLRMMHFQQQVMHKAAAKLFSAKLSMFQDPLSIEITIVTWTPFRDIRLEHTIKSIMDGLNRTVIQDDSLVMAAQIWLEKAKKSYVKPYAIVTLTDNATGSSITFKVDGPVVEKELPTPYTIGGGISYPQQFLNEWTTIKNDLSALQGYIHNSYEICHICFLTNDLSKDVDNMFLTYIGSLRDNGFLDSSNTIGFGMYKRLVSQPDEKTIITLVTK